MSSIVEAWRGKIRLSRDSADRKRFMRDAEMCDFFFRGSMGMMWSDEFRNKFLAGMPVPQFKVTINKAFELVAINGPSTMWDYAGRVIKTEAMPKLPIEVFRNDAERYALYQQELQQETAIHTARGMLMQSYLNYSQREQPGGGLIHDSQLGVTDAIVKGAGVLWVEPYTFPGSNRVLTKCEYDRVERLYFDPDCTRANLTDCYWVAREHYTKYWELEKRFGLTPGTLREKCTHSSRDSLSDDSEASRAARRSNVNDCDLIKWYEVFSKEGIGCRSMRQRSEIEESCERVVGDFAYLAIMDDLEYPLNFPPDVAASADDDEARERLDWPTAYWADGRWPFAMLKFHEVPGSPWPLAPLALGMGELVFLNVIVSCLMGRTYRSCQSLLAVDRSIDKDILDRLKSGEFSGVVEMTSGNQKMIDQLIKWVESPTLDPKIFQVVELVSDMFNRRTGLADVLYGGHAGGKVSRSSADSSLMHESAGLRPEWMRRCADTWQTELADLERIAAGLHVKGEDVRPRFGRETANVWDELIANEDPELFIRAMRCTIQANSTQRPNKFRDSQNLQAMSQYTLPILQEWWQASGDAQPLNAFLAALGEAADQDTSAWVLPEREQPQPDPEQEAQAQAETEAEQQRQQIQDAKLQEELVGKQLRNEKLAVETSGQDMSQDMGMDMSAQPAGGASPAPMEVQQDLMSMMLDPSMMQGAA